MKKYFLILFFLFATFFSFSQSKEKDELKIVGGLRVFPFFITDFKGFNEEYVRVNLELGLIQNNKMYYSIGYTPISKTIYTFEEYWFIDLNKKNPVAFVGALDYNIEPKSFVYSFGFGFQKGFANAKILFSSDINEFHPYLRIGVIFPINWVLYENNKN